MNVRKMRLTVCVSIGGRWRSVAYSCIGGGKTLILPKHWHISLRFRSHCTDYRLYRRTVQAIVRHLHHEGEFDRYLPLP
ncbi:hypothetical protein ACLB1R_28605 [Escherichia coli]